MRELLRKPCRLKALVRKFVIVSDEIAKFRFWPSM
jgi:hypothetical protein